MNTKDIIDDDFDYCPVCKSCGHDGCCPIENYILSHGCTFAKMYAWEVYLNKMIIDEFHKLGLNEIDIKEVYDKAFDRTKEKYGK